MARLKRIFQPFKFPLLSSIRLFLFLFLCQLRMDVDELHRLSALTERDSVKKILDGQATSIQKNIDEVRGSGSRILKSQTTLTGISVRSLMISSNLGTLVVGVGL